MTLSEHVRCPCTMFEQDESCPEGYPSMLCGICNGTGNTTQEQVTALAVEMLKIASDVGEPEDPFAAWESIELIKSSGSEAIAIIEARLPLYTDIGQINALRECISSIRSALQARGDA